MPFPQGSTYGDIGIKYFYIFHFFCVFQIEKKIIFLCYQVLTIALSCRSRFMTARGIPTTSMEDPER
jgi:hypothetical protein